MQVVGSNWKLECRVAKPFSIDILLTRIKQLLDTKEETNQLGCYSTFTPEKRVTDILNIIGIPHRLKGYNFLREAVLLTIQDADMISHVTKKLYPAVAEKFNTTPNCIDRNIRHALNITWKRREMLVLEKFIGHGKLVLTSKPTNSEFIAVIVDKLRIDMSDKIQKGF